MLFEYNKELTSTNLIPTMLAMSLERDKFVLLILETSDEG